MSGHLIGTGLTKRFAGLVANDGIDIEVRPGEIVGLIGPNGAGKTTLFNCVSGAERLTAGSIALGGVDMTAMSAASRARLGIARTFQQSQLFHHLSVEENLLLGRHRRYGSGALRNALGLNRGPERGAQSVVRTIAEQCGLTPVLNAPVGDLPYGTQRMVEVARALAIEPEILLVDEPAAGMDSVESEYFGRTLRRISREREISVLIIEHDVAMVLTICDRVYVLNFGRLISQGTPAEIRADDRVRAAYFGSSLEEAS
ncbi:MAG TPA: ABC transporter ATP-binding protein [Sporichthya sp.]|nr:ABC transporter ATP-binding protein [Sporichthya sp.]